MTLKPLVTESDFEEARNFAGEKAHQIGYMGVRFKAFVNKYIEDYQKFVEGYESGRDVEKIAIAKVLLQKGVDMVIIAESTEFSVEELQRLQKVIVPS